MKIARAYIFKKTFSLAYTSAVAYGAEEHPENIFLRLQTDEGLTAWGCAAPDEAVTGETPQTVADFLHNIAIPALLDFDPLSFDEHAFTKTHIANPAACAAVSMALWDLMGKIRRQPLYQLLGGRLRPLPTSYTISLIPIERALAQTRHALLRGFKILKIKLGEGVEKDAGRIEAIRRLAGSAILFRLDANQAYNLSETLDLLNRIDCAGIQFIEQPSPRGDINAMRRIAEASPVPVMADESVLNSADIRRVIAEQAAPLINIKLMKCGGIGEALAMDALCAEAGIGTMVGCMDESALAISAGLHLAFSMKSLRFIDLDGHFDITNDPAAESPHFADGCLAPSSAPGIGVSLLESAFGGHSIQTP